MVTEGKQCLVILACSFWHYSIMILKGKFVESLQGLPWLDKALFSLIVASFKDSFMLLPLRNFRIDF